MHAIQASEAGGPEVLSYDERPDPAPAEGELLLETLAAGVNRADLLQRRGFYPPPPGASDVVLAVAVILASEMQHFRIDR